MGKKRIEIEIVGSEIPVGGERGRQGVWRGGQLDQKESGNGTAASSPLSFGRLVRFRLCGLSLWFPTQLKS